jgi:hypothetical protein
MSDVATDLRLLASQIEEATRESRACSIAWDSVRALVDHLTLIARTIELSARVPPEAPQGAGREKIGCPSP